jgi:hypothetical protein
MSSSHYSVENPVILDIPIMSMEKYDSIINTHRRPYIYEVKTNEGTKATILGVNHTNDPDATVIKLIEKIWSENKPDVALLEGKTWFTFTWLQNPIKEYGESGKVALLAKKYGIDFYSWEPSREDEVNLLLRKYPADKLAVFYTLRPYLAKVRRGEIANPDAGVMDFIQSRTDVEGLKGMISGPEDIDTIWNEDYAGTDWRTFVDPQNMYPPGFMFDIFNDVNLTRDEHMIQIILECLGKGKNVFITMGVSHAPRIEAALKYHASRLK